MAIRPFPIGLPSGVRIETLKEQAKELLKSVQAGEANALDRIKPYFRDRTELTLQRTQLVVAREHGFSSWLKLKGFCEARDEYLHQKRQTASGRGSPGRAETTRTSAGSLVRRMAASVGMDDTDPEARLCRFCFKSQHQVRQFIVGTGVYICSECVETCTDLVNRDDDGEDDGDRGDLRCDFCDKHIREVGTVVVGSGTNICNECVDLCVEIIAENPPRDPQATPT